jgi:hypothetical protein
MRRSRLWLQRRCKDLDLPPWSPPLTNEGMMVESFALCRIRACRPGSAEDEGDQPGIGSQPRLASRSPRSRPTQPAFAPFLPTRRDNQMMKKRLDKPNPIRAGGSPADARQRSCKGSPWQPRVGRQARRHRSHPISLPRELTLFAIVRGDGGRCEWHPLFCWLSPSPGPVCRPRDNSGRQLPNWSRSGCQPLSDGAFQ